jgi:hypothetical protein
VGIGAPVCTQPARRARPGVDFADDGKPDLDAVDVSVDVL